MHITINMHSKTGRNFIEKLSKIFSYRAVGKRGHGQKGAGATKGGMFGNRKKSINRRKYHHQEELKMSCFVSLLVYTPVCTPTAYKISRKITKFLM